MVFILLYYVYVQIGVQERNIDIYILVYIVVELLIILFIQKGICIYWKNI